MTTPRQPAAPHALTQPRDEGYTHGMAIPDGHKRITVDLPVNAVTQMDALQKDDGIPRQTRIRLLLDLGLTSPDVIEAIRARAARERDDVPPLVDPRRG